MVVRKRRLSTSQSKCYLRAILRVRVFGIPAQYCKCVKRCVKIHACISAQYVSTYIPSFVSAWRDGEMARWRDGTLLRPHYITFLDAAQPDFVEAQASSGKAPRTGNPCGYEPRVPVDNPVTSR